MSHLTASAQPGHCRPAVPPAPLSCSVSLPCCPSWAPPWGLGRGCCLCRRPSSPRSVRGGPHGEASPPSGLLTTRKQQLPPWTWAYGLGVRQAVFVYCCFSPISLLTRKMETSWFVLPTPVPRWRLDARVFQASLTDYNRHKLV